MTLSVVEVDTFDEALFARARASHQAGASDDAARLYRQLLAAHPDHVDVLALAGLLAQQRGDLPAALSHFEHVLQLHPEHLAIRLGAAQVALQIGDADRSIGFLRPVAEQDPHPLVSASMAQALSAVGDFAAAIPHYRRVLAAQGDDAELYAGLGQALLNSGDLTAARHALDSSLRMAPDLIEVRLNRVLAAQRMDELDQAAADLDWILIRHPTHADALSLRSAVALAGGDLQAALGAIEQAVSSRPDDAALTLELGGVLKRLGRLEDAVLSFRRAWSLAPEFFLAAANLAHGLIRLRRPAEARLLLQPLLRRDTGKDAVELHHAHGLACMRLGDFAAAETSLRHALGLAPRHAELHKHLGNLLQDRGDRAAARACFEQALEFRPEFAEAHNDLGMTYLDQAGYDMAMACFRRALALDPEFLEARSNLGVALKESGAIEAGLAEFDRVLAVAPNYGEVRWNRALALLMLGRLAEGWTEYEWRRRKHRQPVPTRSFTEPLWQGEALAGRHILLHWEQGLGDSLHFIRYAPLVAAHGGRVTVEVQTPLVRLMRHSLARHGIDVVPAAKDFPGREGLPAFDLHCPIMSLPGIFGTELGTIPAMSPYLSTEAELTAIWRTRLAEHSGLKVGLVWAGNDRPDNPDANAIDRRRSMRLADFAPLSAIPGVTLFSLQKGPPAIQAQSPPSGLSLVDLSSELNDFVDTAAILENLDLLITVDTSVAHLSGGLGRPTWVLSRFDGCWRWLRDREDSPWYPTARLFRQRQPGQWNDVMDQAAAALVMLSRQHSDQVP